MAVDNIGSIVEFGLGYERARVEVAARNLAIANVAIPPGESSFGTTVGLRMEAGSMLPSLEIKNTEQTDYRRVHDPSHPLADAEGMVNYPRLEPAMEMAILVSATRSYEANIRAYNTLRAMTLKAFEIGKST